MIRTVYWLSISLSNVATANGVALMARVVFCVVNVRETTVDDKITSSNIPVWVNRFVHDSYNKIFAHTLSTVFSHIENVD